MGRQSGEEARRLTKPLAQASLATGTAPQARFYAPQLDGLRFIAAALVFVHHAPAIPLISGIKPYGWAGVDMFLAISAFLITRLILLEHDRTGSFSLRSFYIRRALRIWPLYLSVATLLCLVSLVAHVVSAREAAAWWLSHVSFTNNILTAVKGYSPVPFSSHLWTISLEEQAYILMPLLLLAFIGSGARERSAVAVCVAGLAALLLARLALVLGGTAHPFIWVLPLRGDAFLLGGLGAIVTHNRGPAMPAALWIAGVLLIGSVPFFPPIDRPGLYQVVGYTVLAAGCTAIVVASQYSDMARRILGCPPLRYLGKISYGFYVYHLAALYAAEKLLGLVSGGSQPAVFAAGLLLAVGAASLSYAILERPFLLLKERFAFVPSRPA